MASISKLASRASKGSSARTGRASNSGLLKGTRKTGAMKRFSLPNQRPRITHP